jgi:aspartyl protease family protein
VTVTGYAGAMIRLALFCFAVVWGISFLVPSKSAFSSGPPVRATSPSEAPHDTELEREANGHFYVHAKVNGQLVRFVVDTGATVVALTREDAERVGLAVDPNNFQVIGEGASGAVAGQNVKIGSIEVDGKLVNDVDGVVLANSNMSLLGQTYLSRLNEVKMSGEYMILR